LKIKGLFKIESCDEKLFMACHANAPLDRGLKCNSIVRRKGIIPCKTGRVGSC